MINFLCKKALYIPGAIFFASLIVVFVMTVDQLQVLHNESWIVSLFLLGLVAVVPIVLFLAVLDGSTESVGDEDFEENGEEPKD